MTIFRFKKCIRCGESKPEDCFYRHPKMADGRLGKCISCQKECVNSRYRDNITARRLHDKNRDKTPERREYRNIATKKNREKNPQQYKARSQVNNAVRDGRLTKLPCMVCGSLKSEAHHEDYSKPLEVLWLCRMHHREIEGRLVQTSPHNARS